MLRQTTAVFVALAITGCASRAPSIPEGYTGPQAQLDDSAKTYGSSKADFFVVEQIEGADVDNSLHETLSRNRGKGMHMTPYFITRAVMAEKPIKVALKGRTHYAAPIQALTRTVFEVKGVVEFTPRSNARYVVKGELGPKYSAVWIVEAESNDVVGQKVEVHGSSKLGFMSK